MTKYKLYYTFNKKEKLWIGICPELYHNNIVSSTEDGLKPEAIRIFASYGENVDENQIVPIRIDKVFVKQSFML